MTNGPSTVTIASSDDPELGVQRAALDATLNRAQVQAVVWRALDLDPSARSLRRLVRPGDWVVLKPNIVTSRSHQCSYWHNGVAHPGQVTDVRVIDSLIGYLISRCQPRRITVAEGGAEWQRAREPGQEDGWTVPWPEFDGLSYAGIVAAWEAQHPGLVDIVDLNEDEIRFLPVPDPCGSGIGALQRVGQEGRPPERFGRGAYVPGTGTLRTGYHIPATVLDCDRLICVPAMKTHTCATTLAIKNYVGILPTHPSGVVRKGDVHAGDLQKGFVDLFSYHPADYSVNEGFWGTEGNGPQWGDNVQHNVVVASADPVAADAVTSAVMGFNPEDLDYLHYAARKGFGTLDLARITVLGGPVERVRRQFHTAAGRRGVPFTARGNRTWLVRSGQTQWRLLESEERYVDLDRFFAEGRPEVAWAAADVVASGPQRAWLWASADGRLQVELNGCVVLASSALGVHVLGEHRVEIDLLAGRNALRVRVEGGPCGLGFTALVCDEQGFTPAGIRYTVEGIGP
ncbi:MAG: DUF362 domain-containing protein [Candidatus Latescibacterota bacterium]